MHVDQITVSAHQVGALIIDQVPSLAGQAIVPVDSGGTVNAIFRIGDTATARFPLRNGDPDQLLSRLRSEFEASAEFVRACPVPAPTPLHVGHPGHGYPLPWTVQSWVAGTPATPSGHEHSTALAVELAVVIDRLRACDTRGRRFEGAGRGGRLGDHDEWVADSIARSEGLLDVDAGRALWSRFRILPREDPDLMCHSDLTPSNVVVTDGHLAGLLDTGGFQPADPALDLVVAWHLFAEPARATLRRSLDCSDLEWRGARHGRSSRPSAPTGTTETRTRRCPRWREPPSTGSPLIGPERRRAPARGSWSSSGIRGEPEHEVLLHTVVVPQRCRRDDL